MYGICREDNKEVGIDMWVHAWLCLYWGDRERKGSQILISIASMDGQKRLGHKTDRSENSNIYEHFLLA